MNDKIVRNIFTALLGLALLAIVVGTASAYFVQSSSAGTVQTAAGEEIRLNTITVAGTGTVTVPPDEAVVYLGVQTQSADAQTAQQNNAVRMDNIIKTLKDAGISEEDIETSSYYMYPLRDYEKPGQTITGYVVSNQLKVTVKNIDNVDDVIDTAVDAGVNEVHSVSFTLSDESRQDARGQALKNAVEAARSDADALAEILDVTISGPVEVTTGGGGVITPYEVAEAVALERGVSTPIQPGDVSVSAYVQLTYQFE